MNKTFFCLLCGFFAAGQLSGAVPDSTYYHEFASDAQIRQQVNNTLRSGAFLRKFSSVTYEVDRGFVALTGYVESELDKNEVEARLREIPGVKGIKNDIKSREQKSKFVNPQYPY